MSRRLRALVADDEPMARARLARLLGEDGAVDIVAECVDGADALAAIREQRPDVAFLDIRMPGIDGLQVAAHADDGRTRIVFVTAFAEHAVRAFENAATDYLLKPYSPERLRATLGRVRERLAPERYPERLLLHAGARMRLVPAAEIDALVACANYVEVHCGAARHLARDTLAAVEARLDPAQFLRIHRSRIVRIGAVRDIELLPSGQYLLRLHDGMRLSSGRSYRERVRSALGIAS
jgi:two-component system LytT family response regulator